MTTAVIMNYWNPHDMTMVFRVLCSFISICDEFFSQAVKQKYQSSKFMRISAIEELQSSLIEDWAQKAQEEATVS